MSNMLLLQAAPVQCVRGGQLDDVGLAPGSPIVQMFPYRSGRCSALLSVF